MIISIKKTVLFLGVICRELELYLSPPYAGPVISSTRSRCAFDAIPGGYEILDNKNDDGLLCTKIVEHVRCISPTITVHHDSRHTKNKTSLESNVFPPARFCIKPIQANGYAVLVRSERLLEECVGGRLDIKLSLWCKLITTTHQHI